MKSIRLIPKGMFAILCFLFAAPIMAQSIFFETYPTGSKLPTAVEKTQNIRKISIVRLDEMALRNYLQVAPLEFHNNGVTLPLDIPLPNGTTETFGMVESPVLSPEQAALHPEIKTYTGNGLKNKKYIIRLSLTTNGFNAVILNVEDDAVYFEAYSKADRNLYFSYFSRDAFIPKNLRHHSDGCGVGSLPKKSGNANQNTNTHINTPENNTGGMLRTYKIAIAAAGEFTQAQAVVGDAAKIAAAYASIAEYVNRMNAVYRNEIATTFTLVSGTSIVFSNIGTDPYTHTSSSMMLDQNQTTIDANATANMYTYDVGHVIGQSSGSGEGVAGSGTGCLTGQKARGVTKIGGTPYAQVFFDQTLFHEVGHQFSMSHSYNSSVPVCTTRNEGTSVEPGSGATIMSYGFTCDNADAMVGLVGNDDYFTSTTNGPILVFHTTNYSEMVTFMAADGGCFTSTNTMNNVPVVTEPANYTIPKSTPYALTGSATDADGDALTYCWEGMNTGEAAAPDASTLANTAKPPFSRTYEPSTGGATRNYPLLSAILDGTNYAKGDKLPSVAFTTNHRLTVRDNRAGGGGTAFKAVTVTVDGASGPFVETTNLPASYLGNSAQTITWSVNNTTAAPVSCANVKISISTDGGMTFPTVLLASTPNDGTESVTLPNVATATARIKVEAVGNIFFDISNANFTITTVLPIELTALTAKGVGKTAQLAFQTASEKNNFGFEIEKSTDGQKFEKIGFVKGFGTTQTPQYYIFLDARLSQLSYYRLKQIDFDGQFAYSNVVTAEPVGSKQSLKVYPNPTNGSQISVELGGNTEEVSVVNAIGQTIFQQKTNGETTLRVDVSSWAQGVYFVKTSGNTEGVKFIKH